MNATEQMLARCHPACRSCYRECLTMEWLEVNGLALAEKRQAADDALIPFACSACNLCTVVCTRKLNPAGIFDEWKRQVVLDMGEQAPPLRSLRLTDSERNVYAAFLGHEGLQKMEDRPGEVLFFPGCALQSYTPDLAEKCYAYLQELIPGIGLLSDCCYDMLAKLRLDERYEGAAAGLAGRVEQLGGRTLITVCPTCHYRLQKELPSVEVRSIYALMADRAPGSVNVEGPFAVHDACPDRSTQALGKAVRSLLAGERKVMKHEGQRSICCGAGADLPEFYPELAKGNAERRLEEASASGATTLVTYCTNCAVQLASHEDAEEGHHVVHVLDLFFGTQHDYVAIAKERDAAAAELVVAGD